MGQMRQFSMHQGIRPCHAARQQQYQEDEQPVPKQSPERGRGPLPQGFTLLHTLTPNRGEGAE